MDNNTTLSQSFKIEYENFLTDFRLLKLEYDMWQIQACVLYLNKEVNVDRINLNNIRNMTDAYEHILLWNEKVNNLKEVRNRLLANGIYLPDIGRFLVQLE